MKKATARRERVLAPRNEMNEINKPLAVDDNPKPGLGNVDGIDNQGEDDEEPEMTLDEATAAAAAAEGGAPKAKKAKKKKKKKRRRSSARFLKLSGHFDEDDDDDEEGLNSDKLGEMYATAIKVRRARQREWEGRSRGVLEKKVLIRVTNSRAVTRHCELLTFPRQCRCSRSSPALLPRLSLSPHVTHVLKQINKQTNKQNADEC